MSLTCTKFVKDDSGGDLSDLLESSDFSDQEDREGPAAPSFLSNGVSEVEIVVAGRDGGGGGGGGGDGGGGLIDDVPEDEVIDLQRT